MGFYTGRTGSLAIAGGLPVAKIKDWSLDTTVELLATNDISSAVNTFTPGVKGATGSATLLYYRLESGESASYQQFTAMLSKLLKTGSVETTDRVFMELNVGGGVADDIKFNAYITNATVGVSTGELSTVQIQFTMDGDFSEVVNA
ncbi:hypothetical protein UFOVP649_106 [uncultured Caudovirales phage]|uniref:Tail tube protein n=1 Tax=uncultured Caudovirales phage TaxID=2100421 RepID=A0A6J5NDJ3_9CAUD|nr:hypothetical protein UFOVP649_106 [uncultured Caudovirales phage]